MRRISALFLSLSAFLAGASAHAEEGRFDAQVFRPSAAPRDLVMVRKSEVIGNLSPVVGLYTDLGFDPLVLVNKDTDQAISAVAARLTLTPMAGIGFFNLFDVTLAVPLVAWQSGGNLRAIGTEGPVKSASLGDLRLSTKVSMPFLNRKDEIKKGFGMAIAGDLNLPTGDVNAFTGDGVVTGGASLIADYRFGIGAIISANGGVWIRPDRQFAGVRVGDMASFGLGAEVYVVQRWGLSVIGEVYGYPSLTKFPDSPTQVPAEFLLGARWQGKHGLSITVGGSFGAACSFGAPAFRLWSSITWQPEKSREQEEINRLKEQDEADPDHDGLIGDADHCPKEAGRPENFGCPDKDSDGDGVMDRDDECPDLAGGPHGKKGCPTVYIKGDEIVILDEVHFATDKDILLDDSKPIIEEVAEVLVQHPEIREVQIEGHTDIRATDAYNINLSQRRVNSVMKYLTEERGIDPTRLQAKGFGHSAPIFDDTGCLGPDEGLDQNCRFMTSKNRRVVFRIMRRGAPPPRAISGAPDTNATSLPSKDAVLPSKDTVLPSECSSRDAQGRCIGQGGGILPNQGSVLPNRVLPSAPDHSTPDHVLPGKENSTLPDKGVLERSGTPRKTAPPDPPKDAPAPPAPPQK